jgi:hypothetical protein
MELYAQLANVIAIAVVGVLVWFYLRGRFDRSGRRHEDMRADINRRFDEQRQDTGQIRAELAAIRSDLTYVALAVGARARPEADQA